MQGDSLRFARTVGSWKGRAPQWIVRVRLARDACTAVLEGFSRRWIADLVEGTTTVDSRSEDSLGVLVSERRNARRTRASRGSRSQLSVYVRDESPSRDGAPRYVTAHVGWRSRDRAEVLEVSTGRPLLRLARRWRSGYSACGAFFVCFPERGRRAVIFEPATGARREVALALGAAVQDSPQIGAGAHDAVLLLRARHGDARTLVCVSLDDGSERWRRSVAHDERLVGRCEEPPADEGPLAWSSGGDEALRAYRVRDGVLCRTVRDVGRVWCAAFAPDGSFAVVAFGNVFARVDLRTGEVLAHAEAGVGDVDALAWAHGGDRFAVALGDYRVQVRTREGELVHELEPAAPRETTIEQLAFEPGSARLWCLGQQTRGRRVVLEVLDARSGLSEAVYDLGPGAGEVLSCAPDGSCLWVLLNGAEERAGTSAAVLWSCRERRILVSRTFQRAREEPGLAFAHDERTGEVRAELYLLAARTCERFSVTTGERVGEPIELAGDEAFDAQIVLFSPDGARMYALAQGQLAVFERGGDRGALAPKIVPAEFEFDAYTRKALAAGDSVLAYLDDLGALWLRGVDGRFYEQLVIESQQDRFVELALSPDGRTLLAGTEAGVVLVFDVVID